MTATTVRNEFFDLVRRTLNFREPVRIQHREGDLVMLAEKDYEGLLETLELRTKEWSTSSARELTTT